VKFDLEFARQVIKAEAQAIDAVSNIVDDAFAQAVEMIYECKGSVILSGIGKAGIIGQKISATLASTGTPSHFLHPAEAVHGDLGRLRKDDIVLVLSYGGETDEVIRLINLVKKHGVVRNLEIDLRNKSGEIRHCLFSTEEVELKGERCIVTIGRDVTELRAVEEKEKLYPWQKRLLEEEAEQ